MNLPKWLRRTEPEWKKPLVIPEGSYNILHTLDQISKPVLPPLPKPKGRVIKQTRHSEFNPNPIIQGGRVIKVMPRNLQKIKTAQEKFENDEGPSVEDLED